MNLAVNARDAMPGGGVLTIETSNVTVDADFIAGGSEAGPGRNVRLQVSDGGCGMPADVIEHAFDAVLHHQADGAGSGLGLATVYGIIAQAGGHIQIYSEPGAGTVFSIMLPVTAEAAMAGPGTRASPAVVQGRNHLGRGGRGGAARGGQADIRPQRLPRDHRVERPGSRPGRPRPSRAISIFSSLTSSCRTCSGRKSSEQIRAIKPDIEVLFMSGYALRVLTSQGMLDPDVALVKKPFTEVELMGTAAQILNRHLGGVTAD